MKKTYSKPEIMFEDFTLNVNIAGDCEQTFGLQSVDTCGIPDIDGENHIFAVSIGSNCVIQGGDGELYNGFCYHIPTESNNLFNS